MNDIDLFQAALGLAAPWRVTTARFAPDEEQLEISIDFPPGSRFSCSKCKTSNCPAYDTKETTWRHLDFFQHKTIIRARHPRVDCATCGIHRVEVPWSRSESGFTFLFEAMVMTMAPHLPVAALARHVREYDTLVWRIVHHHVDDARARADHSSVTKVGIDETSIAKGHDYVSLFVDLEKRKVLFVTPGKDASTVAAFADDLCKHGGDTARVTDVCMDMSPAFKNGAGQYLPKAAITFDKFHLVKLMNVAVDEVRRQEQPGNPGLKKTRFLWLRNRDKLSETTRSRVDDLSQSYEKTGRAYRLKESFVDMWKKRPEDATAHLKGWYRWAIRSQLQPVREFAKTVKRNWNGIIRWFASGIANGILEGINSLAQAAKAKVRGYRSDRNFITMIYLLAGKLDFTLPT